ncbi:hypothetical protein DL768_010567 [Monosporascus sp. mg162]|nr:hypothetical protein DL768_010567 [Monosporascus sp. mg162]
MTAEASKPVVLLLSIGDEGDRRLTNATWAGLIAELEAKSDVKRATTAEEAQVLMDQHPSPRGIFIPDAGITKRGNDAVTQRLVQFVRMGGTVIFGGVFSSLIRPPDLDRYFEKSWSLPWKYGSYHRTTVHLNTSSLGRPQSGLPLSYSQKAVNLKNVASASAWYFPGENSVIESRVFDADPIVDKAQAPVAFLKVGEGYLGYTGDVNAEEETTVVVLAMLGLL